MLIRDFQTNLVRQLIYLKVFARRKNLFLLLIFIILVLYTYCSSTIVPNDRLIGLPPQDYRFNQNRSLEHLIENIDLLIEPSFDVCSKYEEIHLLTLVSSAPHHFGLRQAIRHTWAKHQRAYFLMGLHGNDLEKQMEDLNKEAKEHDDLIVFNFHDCYKNSSLKTALMMHWAHFRCPQAEFLMKTVDDVLVNPWMLRDMLVRNRGAELLGYVHKKKLVFSDEYNKWYHWVYNVDVVPQYLDGSAYFIRGENLQRILKKAYEAPLINLEDIYFTYIVAYRGLGLTLYHDWRVSPKRLWYKMPCAYWTLAVTHKYSPKEMEAGWKNIESNQDHSVCSPFGIYLLVNEWILF